MGVHRWGPWVFMACGAGWLFWPIVVCVVSVRINRRIQQSFSQLPPAQQELVRRRVGQGPSPMQPFLSWISAVAAAHFAVGIIWLASRSPDEDGLTDFALPQCKVIRNHSDSGSRWDSGSD